MALLRATFLLAAFLLAPAATAVGKDVRAIGWQTLRPTDQPGYGFGLSGRPAGAEQGQTLSDGMDGETIELAGYILPIDREEELVYEFLLVPFSGGCSHTIAPPANQLVHVFPRKPVKISRIYEPVRVAGTMKVGLELTQLFVVDGPRVMESGYRLSRARVTLADGVSAQKPRSGGLQDLLKGPRSRNAD